MISALSLSNVLTVLAALMCFWTISPQTRGGVVRLWRLAVPAGFAGMVALMLLASVFESNIRYDAEWVIALLLGGVVGRTRGWTLPADIDQQWGLARLPRSMDALVVAGILVALAVIDFTSSVVEDALIEPQHVAAGAAFCAGFLCCRAIAIIVRATRAPHVGLHDITRSRGL